MTDTKLKFGKGNAKLDKQIYTFSIPSGHTCPGACQCLAKADRKTGRIKDGLKQQFRCFSASAEAAFPTVRDSRWRNLDLLKKAKTTAKMRDLILESIPKKAEKIRIHVGGDFFSQAYFDAWVKVAEARPNMLFYAYTKSIPYWANRLVHIPGNMELTASEGGKHDHLINDLGLRTAKVVLHPKEAKKHKLKLDHDDQHAMGNKGDKSFALLIHGMQRKGSEASDAIKRLKEEEVEYAYSR